MLTEKTREPTSILEVTDFEETEVIFVPRRAGYTGQNRR